MSMILKDLLIKLKTAGKIILIVFWATRNIKSLFPFKKSCAFIMHNL